MKTCKIFLFGVGRSGKTTIRKKLMEDGVWIRQVPNIDFELFTSNRQLANRKSEINISIADYQGQNIAQIFNQHALPFFGDEGTREINALVFVVDLFPELLDTNDKTVIPDDTLIDLYKVGGQMRIDQRVEEHRELLTRYNIIQAFSWSLSSNLIAVRLLVNKADLLQKIAAKGYIGVDGFDKNAFFDERSLTRYAEGLFSPVIETIKTACERNGLDPSIFSIHLVSAGSNISIGISNVFGGIYVRFAERNGL